MFGLPPTDTVIQRVGALLSSNASLAQLLAAAGFPPAPTISANSNATSTVYQPSAPLVTLQAMVNLYLRDATAVERAAAAQVEALVTNAYTFAVRRRGYTLAQVVTGGGAFVATAFGSAPEYAPAAALQSCAASGLHCFPGVPCVLPSVFGALTGEQPPVRCGSCPPGYTGDGVACADVDECQDAGRCFAGVSCTNTAGSFSCGACPAGMRGNALGPQGCRAATASCSDGNGGCDPHSVCTDTPSGPVCGARRREQRATTLVAHSLAPAAPPWVH